MLSNAEIDERYTQLHTEGSKRFGWNWYLLNRGFQDVCWELGIIEPDRLTRLLLTRCAYYVFVNQAKHEEQTNGQAQSV